MVALTTGVDGNLTLPINPNIPLKTLLSVAKLELIAGCSYMSLNALNCT